MILITPRGEIDLHDADASDPQGSDLSRAGMPSAPVRRAIEDDPVEEGADSTVLASGASAVGLRAVGRTTASGPATGESQHAGPRSP